MKGKTPTLVLSQQQPQEPQHHQQRSLGGSPRSGRYASSCTRTMAHQQQYHCQHEPRQQNQPQHPHQQRFSSSGTVAQKQQHQQQQYSFQHERTLYRPDNHSHAQHHHQGYQPRSPNSRAATRPPARIPTSTSCRQAGSALSAASTMSSMNDTPKKNILSTPPPKSLTRATSPNSSSLSYASCVAASIAAAAHPAVTLAAAAGTSDANNSDPEPAPGEMEQYIQQNQHHLLQSNRHSQEFRSSNSSGPLFSSDLGLNLRPPALESDVSSSSSLRESSDCDTMETEDDDKGILGSDSNDTDSVADDSLDLDRKSRRRRSIHRLSAKNKTLKSSLAQAKADLRSERHNRALIDQIYLRIRKDLNSKLEAEEHKVANLRAELEQMQLDMQELKDKQAASSYKIGYDSSPYSLSSGLGGLMLHHSNLEDHSEDESSSTYSKSRKAVTSDTFSQSTRPPSSSWRNYDVTESLDDQETQDPEIKKENEQALKVSFSVPEINVQDSPSNLHGTFSEDENEGDDDNRDNDEVPCTMMEILLKKERSRSPEDDVQDPPADANETFDSMAHKFLHQALLAKFTPARTILQLDDLLLKYDAASEDLILVLAQEFMKWWEIERLDAGGAVTGGWGTGLVLMTDTGDRVSAKVAVETKFKSIFVPLLLNYVATHHEQLQLLEKLERNAKASDKLMRNHVSQLMALYKFDVLDADAILEWWRLLQEPEGVFGHGDGLRSMSSKFVAWLEDEEDESDDDSDDDSDSDDDDEEDEEEESDIGEVDIEFGDVEGSTAEQGKIVGLEQLLTQDLASPPSRSIGSVKNDLDQEAAHKEELMVIGSDDDALDDQSSTTSSLERLEERERKRRISFCTNNVYIRQDGQTRVDRAPSEEEDEKHGKKLDQCPPMTEEEDDDEEEEADSDQD